MNVNPQRAQALFLAALDLQGPAARRQLLDRECAGDATLRQRVEALLGAHDAAGGFGEQPSGPPLAATVDSAVMARPGTLLASRYKMLEAIGEGGMGTVWVAEQLQPVRRKVAIKLVKAGMDSQQVLARFEAERQALALMDHPNIAKVFDGGVSEQGRPYFVMEYVKGVPLTEYCDQARLPLAERLKLFLPACQAVQHAHQKGIIHRDLKPSNILVCLYDGKPVPKVIDFGLAKAMHQSLTEHTLFTAHGLMVGTPLYMSPEQAELNNLDVDTRTDIYSLGVILYELLTGSTPLEKQQLQTAALNEFLRLIKEVEPPKPSTRISGSASLPSIAAQRSLEPGQLSRSIRGELDWIVMKALDKERSRRYETANGLARDIERFLNDETVEASPPSTTYRMRKFVRKHRVMLATAAAFALLLIAGATMSTWQWIRADWNAAEARANEKKAQDNARDAVEAEKRATDARAKASAMFNAAVDDFLGDQLFTTEEKLYRNKVGPNEQKFLLRLRTYYDELADSAMQPIEKADAWVRTGVLRARLSDRPAMMDAFAQAKVQWRGLIDQGGDGANSYRRELARTHDRFGTLLHRSVDPNESDYRSVIKSAEDEYRQAADIWRSLAKETPGDVSLQLAIASSLRNQGNMLLDPFLNETGAKTGLFRPSADQYASSLPIHREEVEVLKRAVALAPMQGQVHFRFVDALNRLVTAVGKTGRSGQEFIDLLVKRKIAEAAHWSRFADAPLERVHTPICSDGLALDFDSSPFDPAIYRREVLEVHQRAAAELPADRLLQYEVLSCYRHMATVSLTNVDRANIPVVLPAARKLIDEARALAAQHRTWFPNESEDPEASFLRDWGEFLLNTNINAEESAIVLQEAIKVAEKHAPKPITPAFQRSLARIHSSLGNAFQALTHPEQAIAEAKIAKELNHAAEAADGDPTLKKYEVLHQYANSLRQAGKAAEADVAYVEAKRAMCKEIESGSQELRDGIQFSLEKLLPDYAQLLVNQGQFDRVLELAKEYAAIAPRSSLPSMLAGRVYFSREQWPECVTSLRNIPPGNLDFESAMRLAFSLARQGKVTEAQLSFPRGFSHDYLALLPWFAGQRGEEAVRPLQALLQKFKDNPKDNPFGKLHIIGLVPNPELDWAVAVELAEQTAREAGPGNSFADHNVFVCRYRAGDWKEALDNLPPHLNDSLKNRESLAVWALALHRTGRLDEARAKYAAAVRSGHQEVWYVASEVAWIILREEAESVFGPLSDSKVAPTPEAK